jgi:hypothetical protein
MRFVAKAITFLLVGCVLGLVGRPPLLTPVAAQEPRFDVNDLAYLWPPPSTPADVAALISADEVVAQGRLWPVQAMEVLLRNAQTTSVLTSAGTQSSINFAQFTQEFLKPSTWKVVGFRVDPAAPGASPSVRAVVGEAPQIRIVLQPVTVLQNVVRVHDVAAHLAFSFTSGLAPPVPPSVFPRFIPDRAQFRAILEDLRSLKRDSEKQGAVTAGALRVHPGLQAKVPEFSLKVKEFLKRRLSEDRLTDMAFMGLDPPEPWIFFAMRRGPDGVFARVRSSSLDNQDAQMLSFRGGSPVMPSPTPTNVLPHGGVSTALLFAPGSTQKLSTPVFGAVPRPLNQDIPDIIANPQLSNVLNTDCVSCHTESTRRRTLGLSSDGMFIYKRASEVSGGEPSHLPQDGWNVRNFGWFQRGSQTFPTVTVRTANEAAEAADFVNREYFGGAEQLSSASNPQSASVARPLTLVMTIKSEKDFRALKSRIEALQNQPADRNPIAVALARLGMVHFARFVFLSERQLAVITTYDGAFEDYIDAFVNAIGPVFDQLLAHIADAPPLPVSDHRKEFMEFVKKHDLPTMAPFYSAYPQLRVLDILTLQRREASQ